MNIVNQENIYLLQTFVKYIHIRIIIFRIGCSVPRYPPFYKTLPKFSAFVNWMSVRIYETDCIQIENFQAS